jgi:hypothetical protein
MSQRVVRVWLQSRLSPSKRAWAVVSVPADATADEIRQAACFVAVDGAPKNWEAMYEDAGPEMVPEAGFKGRHGRLCLDDGKP